MYVKLRKNNIANVNIVNVQICSVLSKVLSYDQTLEEKLIAAQFAPNDVPYISITYKTLHKANNSNSILTGTVFLINSPPRIHHSSNITECKYTMNIFFFWVLQPGSRNCIN